MRYFKKKNGLSGWTFIVLLFILLCNSIFAQKATVTETVKSFRTYPFSDPNPVPEMNHIYPYFTFDGYSADSVRHDWKVIVLENPYIEVWITPEIGGKVWGAIEKSTGKPFVYFNRTVKFRDIAMRGPWTSGGIEFNFGAIGHAPSTSTPVDYMIRENEDGSASCFVGTMDLASRTQWRVEIRLPGDRAYFETRSLWMNPTDMNTSLYHWMNSSADVSDDLQYFFPGNRYINHGGEAFSWPIHKNGRDISNYGNNNFGPYKSYHVIGEYTDFFGGIFQNDKFGFGHWSPYGDKPGKKIWIWGLSRQGMIWEDLLTDTDLGNRQYTEIQSGLLFNQAGANSTETPFKHLGFPPGGVENFREIWFPVMHISGMSAVNETGILHVKQDGNFVNVEICPLSKIETDLTVLVDGETVHKEKVEADPLQHVSPRRIEIPENDYSIQLGDGLIIQPGTEKSTLNRPVESPHNFDWKSAQGLYLDGLEKARQRNYRGARIAFEKCLEKDETYIPALVGMAEVEIRRMQYEVALTLATRALAIDAYSPDANFVYGVVARKLGRFSDAKDGFGIASRSMKYRSASYGELAELFFLEGNRSSATEYGRRALDFNRFNLNALKILAILARRSGVAEVINDVHSQILDIDPLNHFVRFEKTRIGSTDELTEDFLSVIQNEFPHETCLELAVGYFNLGLIEDAVQILKVSSSHPIGEYWKAYLYYLMGNSFESRKHLTQALLASPQQVFPFRKETAEVLNWAAKERGHWKTWYYQALLYWSRDRYEAAKALFIDCGDTPDFGPFYLARGKFLEQESVQFALADYELAHTLDGDDWRAIRNLISVHTDLTQYEKALNYAKMGVKRFPESYILQFEYARALLHNKKYIDCLNVLENVHILPHEGARYGREVYRQACVLSAIHNLEKQNTNESWAFIEKARMWPENLGVGRPYDVDERLEDFVEALILLRMKKGKEAQSKLINVVSQSKNLAGIWNANTYLHIYALKYLGRREEARMLLAKWLLETNGGVVAKWARAAFEGDETLALRTVQSAKTEKEGTPWNPVANDPHFKLVLEVHRSLAPFFK